MSSSEFTCGGEDPATHTEPEPMSVFGDLATGEDPPTHTEPEPLSVCGDLATGEDPPTHTEPEPMSVFGDLATGEDPPTHTEPEPMSVFGDLATGEDPPTHTEPEPCSSAVSWRPGMIRQHTLNQSRCSVKGCCEPVHITCANCCIFLCWYHKDTVCADHNILNTAFENVNSIPTLVVVMEVEGACVEENTNNAICTVDKCGECVFIACERCLSFLCYDHKGTDCSEHGHVRQVVEAQNCETVITETAAVGSSDKSTHNTADDSKSDLDYSTRPSRKRKLNKDKWKKNVKSRLRNSGEQYMTKSGKIVAKREWQPSKCLQKKCPLKCHTRVSENDQCGLFNYYWKELGSYNKQQEYLASHIQTSNTKLKTTESSRRKYTAKYFLTVHGEKVRVCRDLFMRTLAETPDRLRYHREHKRDIHGGTTADGRGNHKCRNKILDAEKDRIRQHILSFPAVESHYCRSQSQRRYLSQELNISEMYRLYEKQCKDNKVKAQKESLYRNIFCSEFNYGFHHPKKDQCSVCNKFKVTKIEDDAFTDHQRRKEQARTMKEADKQEAKNNSDGSHCVVTFDLQKVLMCPSGKVGQILEKKICNIQSYCI